ncbi:unnamed protein product [Brassica oleracea var. botrytis]|uniref:(rape) hypothetical protein n=1 Tax=Brassica napus TaxID=3708 RepID=A0A816HZQ8_BRANA|nr:unnamed protein product [Brassica napus]
MILPKQYRCTHSPTCQCTRGHLSEDVLLLVFQHLNWNPKLVATLSCVCKWFDDFAKRVLWKEFCKTRAPRMMLDLQSSGSHCIDGNWRALGKLLIYCSGCTQGGLFNSTVQIPGHFVYRTRFSRTLGRSLLPPQCRTDVLYVSDPCEHLDQGEEGDVGLFRGIFKSFPTSRVRKVIINKAVPFHPSEVCPYCKAKLWSMLQAKIIPQSACVRLEAYEDCIEYFVCLNGHLLGICTLAPLSDSEEAVPSEDSNHTEKKQGNLTQSKTCFFCHLATANVCSFLFVYVRADNGSVKENGLKRRHSLLGGSENGPSPQKRLTSSNQCDIDV